MCSSRDVKHKSVSKNICGLPLESRMFLCDMMEMYGSNNCFTLKLPPATVSPWHGSLCGEMAFFIVLLSQDCADVLALIGRRLAGAACLQTIEPP
jgi:hypothetical protein